MVRRMFGELQQSRAARNILRTAPPELKKAINFIVKSNRFTSQLPLRNTIMATFSILSWEHKFLLAYPQLC